MGPLSPLMRQETLPTRKPAQVGNDKFLLKPRLGHLGDGDDRTTGRADAFVNRQGEKSDNDSRRKRTSGNPIEVIDDNPRTGGGSDSKGWQTTVANSAFALVLLAVILKFAS